MRQETEDCNFETKLGHFLQKAKDNSFPYLNLSYDFKSEKLDPCQLSERVNRVLSATDKQEYMAETWWLKTTLPEEPYRLSSLLVKQTDFARNFLKRRTLNK